MHVVALNWRDLQNPRAGGAETHLEEILRYLARRGHRCTLLTSRFRGGPRDEEVDGYRIVRGGHEYDFNLVVPFLFRRLAATDPPDVVLDDINKIPFYSPLFTAAPVLAIVPHLMGTAVFHELNLFLATVLYGLELPVRRVYRREGAAAQTGARGREPLLPRGLGAHERGGERLRHRVCRGRLARPPRQRAPRPDRSPLPVRGRPGPRRAAGPSADRRGAARAHGARGARVGRPPHLGAMRRRDARTARARRRRRRPRRRRALNGELAQS